MFNILKMLVFISTSQSKWRLSDLCLTFIKAHLAYSLGLYVVVGMVVADTVPLHELPINYFRSHILSKYTNKIKVQGTNRK